MLKEELRRFFKDLFLRALLRSLFSKILSIAKRAAFWVSRLCVVRIEFALLMEIWSRIVFSLANALLHPWIKEKVLQLSYLLAAGLFQQWSPGHNKCKRSLRHLTMLVLLSFFVPEEARTEHDHWLRDLLFPCSDKQIMSCRNHLLGRAKKRPCDSTCSWRTRHLIRVWNSTKLNITCVN